MTGLVESRAPARPPAISNDLDRVLRITLNRLDPPFGSSPLVGTPGRDPYKLKPEDALSPANRGEMQSRLLRLDAALWPAGHVIAAEEYRSLCGMRAPGASTEEIERETVVFIRDTEGLPAFALREACDAFRLGRIGDGEWMPKVGQVRREAERLAAPYLRHRHEVQAVLSATLRKPENLSRKAALLTVARGLVKTMPIAGLKAEFERTGRTFDEEVGQDPREQRPEEAADAFQARMLRHAQDVASQPLPKVSPALRRSLGLPPEDESQDGRFGVEHAA